MAHVRYSRIARHTHTHIHLHTHTYTQDISTTTTHINCQQCWATEIPFCETNKRQVLFIRNLRSCVCVNIHVHTNTHTHTYIYICLCLCVGKLQFSYLMAPASVRLSELCALFAFGALSKANSEIKAHKFILANCRNKRRKERTKATRKAKWSENLRGICWVSWLNYKLDYLWTKCTFVLWQRLPTTLL